MDLVDIDQVLDNLELREAADERTKEQEEFKVGENRYSSAQKTDVALKSFAGKNGTSSHFHIGSVTPSALASSTSNKSFVGVSQVFNSLDEYRKNVETLESAAARKYDDEYKLIDNAEVKAEDRRQDVKAPLPCATETNAECKQATYFGQEKYGDDGDSEDGDDLSNDVEKFTENVNNRRRYERNDKEDLTTASDSLTTSSSSTFSSGLSPGLVSTTEEQSTPLSGGEYEEEDRNEVSVHLRDNKSCPPAEVDFIPSIGSEVMASVRPEEAAGHLEVVSNKAAVLEDLAVELSSISINSQSDLPREMTVSSALGGIINALSETNTTSLHSQIKDLDPQTRNETEAIIEKKSSLIASSMSALESESMVKQDNKSQHDVRKELQEVAVAGMGHGPNNEPLLVTAPQPITFGSTMDEISDTELDSMLQEMDIDEAYETNTVAATPKNTDETQEYQESDRIMNADSFSQASTVEFSEIRAQQPSQTEFSHSCNSISSSYSSSESSLENEPLSSDGVRLSGGEHTRRRPKRPTTLDLPVMKMNLNANAGQTPPAVSLAEIDAEPDSIEDAVSTKQQNEATSQDLQHFNASTDHDSDSIADETVLQNAESAAKIVKADKTANSDGDEGAEMPDEISEATGYSDPHAKLGKIPPIWVPDNMATSCMQCHVKFTMIKRRHHCRACGKVLCSLCCSQKFKLEFLSNPESRVCLQCFLILSQRQNDATSSNCLAATDGEAGLTDGPMLPVRDVSAAETAARSPNPNNPMEYCSTIPPHRQVSTAPAADPPTVIVPVGVLKKEGSNSSNSSNYSSKKARKRKSVMFSDGIAPGSDLASLENQWTEAKHARRQQHAEKPRKAPLTQPRTEPLSDTNPIGLVAQLFRGSTQPAAAAATADLQIENSASSSQRIKGEAKTSKSNSRFKTSANPLRTRRLPPSGCDEHGCLIPSGENSLPPIIVTKGDNNCEFDYKDVSNNLDLVERLQRETLKFAVQSNFFIYVKIIDLKCCMNKTVINFTTSGLHHVGNDEIIILLEYQASSNTSTNPIPKDVFVHLNEIYVEAEKCNPIDELNFTMPQQSTFLGSREYGGFLYIRASFQCLQDVVVPESPFLIGVLIHKHEVPWAKVFPLRLMLRLGAQYRYYPCPHISVLNRESVYGEIAQTIINFLADFRNYSYTLPSIKGMYIHMEDRQTSVLIPRNRHEDVIKAINNSSDHILAFAGNFSKAADGHLVCIQNTKDESAEMFSYSTQAINIQGQPRKVTGASFFILNEALKSTSGLSGKCSIVEDGLMVQILPTKMEEVRTALKNKTDIEIVCGPLGAEEQQKEIVSIKWVDNDRDFGIGVVSPIDAMSLEGVSGMRVHASFNYSNTNFLIRLTEIYMIKVDDWNNRIQSQDITRISEQIARSTSVALLPFLDLLMANGNSKIGLRVTLHQENVCYEAGTRSTKLPPLYMNALDNHLIPTLHKESNGIDDAIILELIFYILNA